MRSTSRHLRIFVSGLLVLVLLGIGGRPADAQKRPPRGKMRTDISPKLLVSFERSTPFNQFVKLLNPLFERQLDKTIVDPKGRTTPIGVSISGMYYFDAFEKVLSVNNLTYQKTETAFLIQPAGQKQGPQAPPQAEGAVQQDTLATLSSREVRINAILFNLNLTKVRNLGLKWNEILGSTQGQGGRGGGGGGGGRTGQGGQQRGRFSIRTDNLFESVDNILQAPDVISLSRFRRFLNLLEQDNVGRTVANPQITVKSGEQGRIQIGQDIPIQTTDFAGNTVTKFFSTGIIVDVTPTVLSQPVADTSGAPVVDFIHLDIRVEDSNSQPTASGTIINRNEAQTQVLLLDGEATAIGGLISTQKTTTRSGVPILKDLPAWFFGLRYIFGNETTNITKQELLIVLQAEVVKPLRARAREKFEDEILDQRRRNAREALRRVGKRFMKKANFPKPRTKNDSLAQDGQPERQ